MPTEWYVAGLMSFSASLLAGAGGAALGAAFAKKGQVKDSVCAMVQQRLSGELKSFKELSEQKHQELNIKFANSLEGFKALQETLDQGFDKIDIVGAKIGELEKKIVRIETLFRVQNTKLPPNWSDPL